MVLSGTMSTLAGAAKRNLPATPLPCLAGAWGGYRLEDVKLRGKEIEDELQKARAEAQQALQRFTAVKNERYVGRGWPTAGSARDPG